jgi:hypothetical protein
LPPAQLLPRKKYLESGHYLGNYTVSLQVKVMGLFEVLKPSILHLLNNLSLIVEVQAAEQASAAWLK